MNPPTEWRQRAAVAAVAMAAAVTLAACGSTGPAASSQDAAVSRSADDSLYQGSELEAPYFSKPDLVLSDTNGKPFDLRKKTAGRAVLLFFGYTNCPDVCPTTLGDIALALKEQPKDVRDKTDVVFVTTDPERDTPKALGKWLAAFDHNFIGLSGDLEKIKAAARPLGISVEDPTKHHDGSVTSSHGGQVVAFLPTDDKAHVVYLTNTPLKTFAHDLPLLAQGKQTDTAR
ncbi:SCO family protein [Streptomyces sp. G44]|uniref:SCO family protein n=1 Tax=Streptomyces sp. G44 TaxID=2807632 RepID=UPI00195FF127|nr:SCO family protein [Streptomyces sp. G44]MBM7167125.1 SCO family protein [Streptomyces sp. G44]